MWIKLPSARRVLRRVLRCKNGGGRGERYAVRPLACSTNSANGLLLIKPVRGVGEGWAAPARPSLLSATCPRWLRGANIGLGSIWQAR